jgi:hypothetical protein
MIEIEFEPPSVSACECCGNDTVRLTRFVMRNGDAHSVYYLQYTTGHDPDYMSGLISLGEWGESGSPSDRLAFPFRLWATEDSYNVGLTDAAESPWVDSTFLGRLLDRDEALIHPWCKEVFHLTDHITREDPEAIAFLARASQGGT